jgi:hypothetical protein
MLRLHALMLGCMLAIPFAFSEPNMLPPGQRRQQPAPPPGSSVTYYCVKHGAALTNLDPPFGMCPEKHLLRLDDSEHVRRGDV